MDSPFRNNYIFLELKMEIIAVFDFDGTLTKKDTFIEFAKYVVGKRNLLFGILKNFLWLAMWKLKLLDGGKAKQRLFSSLFKGMSFSKFQKYCKDFASLIESFERQDMVSKLNYHIRANHKVYIISASIADWIAPWAQAQGVMEENILGTGVEIDTTGRITGLFSTPNCNGVEKVKRLREKEPDISVNKLYVYGDSSGDQPLFTIADHAERVK